MGVVMIEKYFRRLWSRFKFLRQNENNILNDKSGFSLLELLTVVGILGVLVAMAIPSYRALVSRAHVGRCISELKNIETAITAFFIENGYYPNSLSDVKLDHMTDPFGNKYVYVNLANDPGSARTLAGDSINIDFDLFSKGTNGGSAASILDALSRDDVFRANEGTFFGISKSYF